MNFWILHMSNKSTVDHTQGVSLFSSLLEAESVDVKSDEEVWIISSREVSRMFPSPSLSFPTIVQLPSA
jgi:hypothetical protein